MIRGESSRNPPLRPEWGFQMNGALVTEVNTHCLPHILSQEREFRVQGHSPPPFEIGTKTVVENFP